MQTHVLHTVCIWKTLWIAFYLITLTHSTIDYFHLDNLTVLKMVESWHIFAFKIIHFTSRCRGLGFFAERKRLVSGYFKVIAMFLSSMQIKHDRCVADNYLPLNSCHEWTLLWVKHKKWYWLLHRWSVVTNSQHWGASVFHKGQRLNPLYPMIFQTQQNELEEESKQ